MTIKFQLDRQWQDEFNPFKIEKEIHSSITSNCLYPHLLTDHSALPCHKCEINVLRGSKNGVNGKIRLRITPSQPLNELVELWKCCEHEEEVYKEMVSKTTRDDGTSTFLVDFNTIKIPSTEWLSCSFDPDINKNNPISCQNCGENLGYIA